MKVTKYIVALGVSLLGLTACESDLEKVTFDPDNTTASALLIDGEPQELYTLEPGNSAADAFTVKWTQPDMGYQASVTNVLQMDLQGKKFANAQTLDASADKVSYTAIAGELNKKIQTLLGKYEMETQQVGIELRIASVIALSADTIFSSVLTLNVLPYSGEAEYPVVYIIGDYSSWKWDKAQTLFSFSGDANYSGIIDFGASKGKGFKVTGDKSWKAGNWGIDKSAEAPMPEASSIILINDGGSGNISCYSQRFYRFYFNTETMKLEKKLAFDVLGIVGDAVGGWSDDIEMNFDTKKQRFYADVELTAGSIKFRADGKWDTSFGSKTEGLLNSSGNIKVTAGKYRIYVNLNNSANQTYELNADDYGKE